MGGKAYFRLAKQFLAQESPPAAHAADEVEPHVQVDHHQTGRARLRHPAFREC
jgi:hypothetical protein